MTNSEIDQIVDILQCIKKRIIENYPEEEILEYLLNYTKYYEMKKV